MSIATTTQSCTFANATDIDPSFLNADFEYRTQTCNSTTTYPTTATSTSGGGDTNITVDAGYTGPTFNEWLFVAGIIIFLLSFSFWGKISWTNVK